ncbi:putative trans-sialidase [Trypanosoma cruzi]|nr:putative trans-sialidase [Trypanosoma cruzi]
MPIVSYLWTRCIHVQRTQHDQKESLAAQTAVKNGRGAASRLWERKTAAPFIPPPPTNPHRRRTAPPMLHPILQIARRNHREGQRSLSANDARLWYDELPTSPLWASYARRANEVARVMWASSKWEQRMSLAGQFTTFCRTHELPMNEETCAAFLMAIEVAPSTRLQYARMLRSILEMNRTPLDMMILGIQKIAARWETKQARPLTEEEMNQVIRSRTDWRERVVFRLAWITASRLFGIASLTSNNFTLEPDGTLILDWSVAPKTARADPHRAFRSVRIRGQDAFDTIKLCRTLQENEKLTNITNAKVERALAPWGATAHSIKRGVLRHAAEIVETYNLDPHVISQLAKHVNPFEIPQNTVRYLRKYTTMLTQVSSLVALM